MYHPVFPHSPGLPPVSMTDPSRVSTADCILLNRSNYRKENKPGIVKPHPPPLRPSPEGQPYFWLQQVSLTCMFKGAASGNTKAPLNRAAKVVHWRSSEPESAQTFERNLAEPCSGVHAAFKLVKVVLWGNKKVVVSLFKSTIAHPPAPKSDTSGTASTKVKGQAKGFDSPCP